MRRLLIASMALICTIGLFANELIHSDYDNYFKYLELTGRAVNPNLTMHSFLSNDWQYTDSINPWSSQIEKDRTFYSNDWMGFQLLDTELLFTANSYHQWDFNDGAMWQGKGLNGRLRAGILWESDFFTVVFYPEIWFAQNLYYDIMNPAGSNPYSYFNQVIDYPQRMGDSPLFDFNWGQTSIRFNYKQLYVGVSTEELWLGPTYTNALLISNNSGGFPHAEFGLSRIDTLIGSFEARYLWGVLEESDFFNTDAEDDWRLFSNISMAYAPFFIPGVTIGLNWVAQTPGGDFEARDFFIIPLTIVGLNEDNHTNDNDQKVSVTVDWKFPAAGFELYCEIAAEDFNSSPLQIIEHTLFYTLGGAQVINLSKERGFMYRIEFSNLGVSDTQRLIWNTNSVANYYTHHRVTHGYTNSGQIFGAAIGPGSDSQFFSVSYYDKWGFAEIYMQRWNKDKTYIYNDIEAYKQNNINAEIAFGLKGLLFLGPFDVTAEIAIINEKAHHYIAYNEIVQIHGELGLRYRY